MTSQEREDQVYRSEW